MTWHGWIWSTQRQHWERVCQEEGLSACSKRLGEIVRTLGTKDKYATMTGGAVPGFRPSDKKLSPAEQGRVE